MKKPRKPSRVIETIIPTAVLVDNGSEFNNKVVPRRHGCQKHTPAVGA